MGILFAALGFGLGLLGLAATIDRSDIDFDDPCPCPGVEAPPVESVRYL